MNMPTQIDGTSILHYCNKIASKINVLNMKEIKGSYIYKYANIPYRRNSNAGLVWISSRRYLSKYETKLIEEIANLV